MRQRHRGEANVLPPGWRKDTKAYRNAIRRSWMGVAVHPSAVVSGRDRTPTAATRRQTAKSRCLPHAGGGESTIRRRLLELIEPRIVVGDACGEIRRPLLQEIGSASCRERVCQYV